MFINYKISPLKRTFVFEMFNTQVNKLNVLGEIALQQESTWMIMLNICKVARVLLNAEHM